MELIPIEVYCHSGFKAHEYPTRFIWDHVEFEILEIVDQWHEAYRQTGSAGVTYFKVKTSLKGTFLLKHDLKEDCWFLIA